MKTLGSPANGLKTPSTISDLRDLASSQTEDLKKFLDLSHSEVLKEVEASKTRISKRFKIQTQACMQLTEEIEKDFNKISDRISENTEVVKDSYMKITSEVQASTSRVPDWQWMLANQ
ncbi:uncharacterized protein LOC109851200 isoform X2 [Asparagus officinalis]|uniref:uncharacterized protein LOC109851200 isoform X2 n=1 Tax=Asparagus officinalis TaxID=4686 RepID=UPI00098E340D|nr:uncharacterized protein LOC109851200 isoform X2 [Asparagus officinalis]